METNRHHTFWQRRDWDSFKLASEIRNDPRTIQDMIVPIHNELHHYVEPIQLPSARISRLILQNIYPLKQSYTGIDTAKSLVQDLWDTEANEYAEHLDRQIPFMELSIKAMKRRSL